MIMRASSFRLLAAVSLLLPAGVRAQDHGIPKPRRGT